MVFFFLLGKEKKYYGLARAIRAVFRSGDEHARFVAFPAAATRNNDFGLASGLDKVRSSLLRAQTQRKKKKIKK